MSDTQQAEPDMDEPHHPSDGELLQAFRTRDDHEAFAQVMRRHGRLVLDAARSAVGGASVAEDIAQVTFLTLARKAAALETASSVAGWLCHVALCLGRDERRKESRRQAREQEATMLATQLDPPPGLSATARAVLYEELGKLSETQRQAVILHHLEGLSYEAAAATLGCNPGTFSARLTVARQRLRKRLAARGVTLGADGIGGVLEEGATSVVLPAAFVAATCQAACLVAAGKTLSGSGLVSAKVATLTKSALKTLFWAKVKIAAPAAVVLTVSIAAGGLLTSHLLAHRGPPPAVTAGAPAPGVTQLSAGDQWIRELLARAEAGATLDVAQFRATDTNALWFVEKRTGAGCLFWNAQGAELSQILLDMAGWKRGVFVASLMIPPEGKLPPELAPPGEAKPVACLKGEVTQVSLAKPCVVLTYRFDQPDLARGNFAKRDFRCLVPLQSEPVQRGVWYRCVVYVDAETSPKYLQFLWTQAPEETSITSASAWHQTSCFVPVNASSFGLGLAARDLPVLARGLKFVPLGPDMPPYPSQKRD